MSSTKISVTRARSELLSLTRDLEAKPETGAIAITKEGKPVVAMMSWQLYESILETMDILSDPEAMDAFRQGVKDMKEGRVIPWEQVKKDLELN